MKNLKSNFGFGTIRYLLTICTLFGAYAVNSQNGGVAITDDGSNPDASAMLDVKSTSKGVLVPRLNFLQISAIDPVADGLLIYNTDLNNFWYDYGHQDKDCARARKNHNNWINHSRPNSAADFVFGFRKLSQALQDGI